MKTKKIFAGFLFMALFFASGCSTNSRLYPSYTNETEVINVKQGSLQGIKLTSRQVELFAGIPYAEPPVGSLRWKEPVPKASWQGTLKADHFAPIAWQSRDSKFVQWIYRTFIYHNNGDRQDFAECSEDCLYLNIWRPENIKEDEKLPVLFYIHGGSLMTGSSMYESYDGATMAENNVIMVTVAYRLGVFGYLALDELQKESPNNTTGNYGLLDQIEALRWVHENIEAFGGDSNNITIAGESAGATSVSALCVSPLAKGLFKRAIAESSGAVVKRPPHTYREMSKAKETGKAIMQEYKVSTLEELRSLSAKKLIKTKYRNDSITVDGYAIKERPYDTYKKGLNNEEAILGGFNANEAYFFNFFGEKITLKNYEMRLTAYFGDYAKEIIELYPAANDDEARKNWDQICGALWFSNSHHVWSNLLTEQGKDAYEYYFTKENGGIGTNHSGEIIYAYGNVPLSKYYTKEDHDLEKAMVSYLINFVTKGNPNGTNVFTKEELPLWPRYNDRPGMVQELGEKIQNVKDPHLGFYDVLDRFMGE